ncbi:MAG: hypothetical protein ABJJ37_05705 [Roseibium sp.]
MEFVASMILGALAEFLGGYLKDLRHERLIRRDERRANSTQLKKVISDADDQVRRLSGDDLRDRLRRGARARADP